MMFKLFFLIINLSLVKSFTSSTVLFQNKVKHGVIPYLATIHNDDNLLCCGAIVDEDLVIAPANCVRGNQSFFISTESTLFGTFGQTVVGKNIFFMDPFSELDAVALIQTNTPINFNDNVKAIDIMSEEKIDEVLEYTKYGIITGWGPSSGTKKIIKTLEQAKVDLMYPDECFKKLKRFNFTENLHICVTPKMKEFRSIYYGGPLIIEDQLVAINLREKFPIGSTYFVYTKVDSVFKAFVKKHIRHLIENMDNSSSESSTETFSEPTSSLTSSNSSSNNEHNDDNDNDGESQSEAAVTSSESNNTDYPHNSSGSSNEAFSEPTSSSPLTSSNSSSNNENNDDNDNDGESQSEAAVASSESNNTDYPHNSSESSTEAFSEPTSSSYSLTLSNSSSNNENNDDDGESRPEAARASFRSNNMDYPYIALESSAETFSEPTSSSLTSSNSSSGNENNDDNDDDGESQSEAAEESYWENIGLLLPP